MPSAGLTFAEASSFASETSPKDCGTAETESDGTTLRVGYGEMAILAPRSHVRLLWQPFCKKLIVKLPNELIRPERSHAESGRIWSRTVAKVASASAARWLALLQHLSTLMPTARDPSLGPSWIAAAVYLQAQGARGSIDVVPGTQAGFEFSLDR